MKETMEKLADDHASFLSEFAYHLGCVFIAKQEDLASSMAIYTKWLSGKCVAHGFKHGVEWAESNHAKIEPEQQDGGVAAKEEAKTHTDVGKVWDKVQGGSISTQGYVAMKWRERNNGIGYTK